MLIFNKDIDYFGQDIHMVRNGEEFPFPCYRTNLSHSRLIFTKQATAKKDKKRLLYGLLLLILKQLQ